MSCRSKPLTGEYTTWCSGEVAVRDFTKSESMRGERKQWGGKSDGFWASYSQRELRADFRRFGDDIAEMVGIEVA
jgi:hypothetical protein